MQLQLQLQSPPSPLLPAAEVAPPPTQAAATGRGNTPTSSAEPLQDEEDTATPITRQVKALTIQKHTIFAAAALRRTSHPSPTTQMMAEGGQRTALWHKLRAGRLTASAFPNALGWFDSGRQNLWEEKLELRPKFAGNEATQWGNQKEQLALEQYQAVTGHSVTPCGFQILRDDDVHSWLGASPDGLISGRLGSEAGGPGQASAPGQDVTPGQEMTPGVLEIKCPYARQQAPPSHPQWYYMPQMQGLLEIFDREYCNAWIWTPNGAALFRIDRDRSYWRDCYKALADFWYGHLVPAKLALSFEAQGLSEIATVAAASGAGLRGEKISHPATAADPLSHTESRLADRLALVEAWRPPHQHPMSKGLQQRSKAMAARAPSQHFPAWQPSSGGTGVE